MREQGRASARLSKSRAAPKGSARAGCSAAWQRASFGTKRPPVQIRPPRPRSQATPIGDVAFSMLYSSNAYEPSCLSSRLSALSVLASDTSVSTFIVTSICAYRRMVMRRHAVEAGCLPQPAVGLYVPARTCQRNPYDRTCPPLEVLAAIGLEEGPSRTRRGHRANGSYASDDEHQAEAVESRRIQLLSSRICAG
jgi:hypothetical protein